MPTATYDLITSNIVSSNVTSITFSSISTSYIDLILVIKGVAASGDFYPRLRFNGVTSSSYDWGSMHTTGATLGGNYGNETGLQIGNNQFFDSNESICVVQLLSYSKTSEHKTTISRIGRAANGNETLAGRFQSNSAITEIQLYSSNGNPLTSGTRVYLYGIVA